MAEFAVVAPPTSPVYRVAYGPDPWAVREWDAAAADGTFGNRFDDPGGMPDLLGRRGTIRSEDRFRCIYCSTLRAGAFGETLARFRSSLALLALAEQIEHLDDEPLDHSLFRGSIPQDWRYRRRLGMTRLDPTLRFVDIAAGSSLSFLRSTLAPIAASAGIDDVDLSAVTSHQRRLTQEAARHIYDLRGSTGHPSYAGIRYVSRLNADWECWAIFDTRMIHAPQPSQPIFPDDPGLLAAATILNLQPPLR